MDLETLFFMGKVFLAVLAADLILILLFGGRVSSYIEKKVQQMNENVSRQGTQREDRLRKPQ